MSFYAHGLTDNQTDCSVRIAVPIALNFHWSISRDTDQRARLRVRQVIHEVAHVLRAKLAEVYAGYVGVDVIQGHQLLGRVVDRGGFSQWVAAVPF